MDPRRLPQLAIEILPGMFCLDSQHRLQHIHGGHSAQSAFGVDLSFFHFGHCDLFLGCLDPAQLRHAGQLPVVDLYRLYRSGQDVDLLDFLAAGFLAADRRVAGFLAADPRAFETAAFTSSVLILPF